MKLRARRQWWHKAKSRGGRRGCAGVGSACSCPLTSQAPSYLQSEVSGGEGHVGEADGSLDVVVTLQDGDAGGEPGLEGRTQWDTCKGGNHTLSCPDPAFQQGCRVSATEAELVASTQAPLHGMEVPVPVSAPSPRLRKRGPGNMLRNTALDPLPAVSSAHLHVMGFLNNRRVRKLVYLI